MFRNLIKAAVGVVVVASVFVAAVSAVCAATWNSISAPPER